MDNYASEFIDKYFECYMGSDGSYLFLRVHPTEDVVYATLIEKGGMMYNDMYIANPDDTVVKGVHFEYACIQNKSLELEGEYGEADYDTFLHEVNDDELMLLYTPDARKPNIITRKITKYTKMVTPKIFSEY